MTRTCSIAAVLLWTTSVVAESPKVDFNDDVTPILNKYCVGCHSADNDEGGLDLETHAAMLSGGKRGPAFVAGKPDESLLVLLVEKKKKPFMPPEDEPQPSPAEIAVLRRWVEAGALAPKTKAEFKLVTPKIKPRRPPVRSINSVAFAPDGKLVAYGTQGVITLVDPKTGFIVRQLEGITGPVNGLEFSRDGKTLVVAAGEPGLFGEATLWNVADGKRRKTFKGHRDNLYVATLTPDEVTLATAGYDKDIILWDVESGEENGALTGHQDAIFGLAFSPDGKFLASASGDRTVKLWDPVYYERLDTFSHAHKGLNALAFHPDSHRLAAAGIDRQIRVWKLSDTGKEGSNRLLQTQFAHETPIVDLAYTPDGKALLTTAEDRTIKVWDANTLKQRQLFEKQPDWVHGLAIASDNKQLLVGRHDGSLGIYQIGGDAKGQPLVARVKPPEKPEISSLSQRGVKRGTSARIVVRGKHLATAEEVSFTNRKITGTIAKEPAPKANEVAIEVTIPESVGPNKYELSLKTKGGTSGRLPLWVDTLPQSFEQEPNQTGAQANNVATPTGFWGTLQTQGDVDVVGFDVRKGQTIVVETAANRLGSKLDPVVTIRDPAGRILTQSNNYHMNPDPVLTFTAPAEGRYHATIHDLKFAGSGNHFYRMAIGDFPFVTGVYPLAVAPKKETELTLSGYNLEPNESVKVSPPDGSSASVFLDPNRYRYFERPSVSVVDLPQALEAEPNDTASTATAMMAPGVAHGRILTKDDARSLDADLYRFRAKKGQTFIIETEASRRRSPVDTKIEVLDASGKPIERLWLRAILDCVVDFRHINSDQAGLRTSHMLEFELNQLVYLNGDVGKIFRLPRGPDSDFLFYTNRGKRRAYFDTNATAHAKDDPAYLVEPHPPGTKLAPNGLPVFKLHYANDDAGDREIGADSRLFFTAPADGDYLVRVEDTYGRSGPEFAYRLTVRPPAPDFSVSNGFRSGKINAGSGKEMKFSANRVDGFDGPIAVTIEGLPKGYSVSSPTVIEAGHAEAWAVLRAAVDAPKTTPEEWKKVKITASAMIAGKTVSHPVAGITNVTIGPKPKILVHLYPAEVTVRPDSTTPIKLRVDRDGYTGPIRFDDRNLPHGMRVDNIGLNGILLTPNDTERTLYLRCDRWVQAMKRPFFLVSHHDGRQASNSVTIEVVTDTKLADAKAAGK
ncbi:WD domain, G-beta repeat [Planctomycetes bacterium Pan216]|uniref:WD domain, G-beta repeat n=1 Tax=Kolteria novifilia TaxID=2527975 RepID=A0A518B577_9BACT|nr:WD domain, G-beta repeat [Planctomycetes bacterium Pan216]